MSQNWRVTYYFQQAEFGWSETYWNVSNSIVDLVQKINDLTEKRLLMMQAKHLVSGIRVSQEGTGRASQLFIPPGGTPVGSGNAAINVPPHGTAPAQYAQEPFDQIRACMQTNWTLNGARLGLRYFTPIPDVLSKTENLTIDHKNPSWWWKYFEAWRDLLIANGWSIKTQVRDETNPLVPIGKWIMRDTDEAILGLQIPFNKALAVVEGSKIAIQGVRMKSDGIRSPNGIKIVDQVIPQQQQNIQRIFIRGLTNIFPDDISDIMGKVRLVRYDYAVPDNIFYMRAGIHQRGKPSNSPVGRAKKKKYVR